MPKCYLCGELITSIPHRCKYCNEYYCSKHRLPENHSCLALKKKNITTELKTVEKLSSKEFMFEIRVFICSIILYLFTSIRFFVVATKEGYFVFLIFLFCSLLQLFPVLNFYYIRKHLSVFENRIRYLGPWKKCSYLDSFLPILCIICDQRKTKCNVLSSNEK